MDNQNKLVLGILQMMDSNKWGVAKKTLEKLESVVLNSGKIKILGLLVEKFVIGEMNFLEANNIVHALVKIKSTNSYEMYLWIKVIAKLSSSLFLLDKLQSSKENNSDNLYFDQDNLYQFIFIQGKQHMQRAEWGKAVDKFNLITPYRKMTFEFAILISQSLHNLGQHSEANKYFIKAKEINPEHELIYSYQGVLKINEKDCTAAKYFFSKAIKCNPFRSQNIENLALAYLEEHNLEKSIKYYKQAIELEPHNHKYIEKLATIQLMNEDYKHGLENYESRLMVSNKQAVNIVVRKYRHLVWSGEKINNKKLLLVSEQGLGDLIFIFRYIPLLLEKNVDVSLITHKSLYRLINISYPKVKLVEQSNKTQCDFIVPIMSLLKIFKTSSDNILQNVPYFSINRQLNLKWSKIVKSSKPKIGLVWFGNKNFPFDSERSMQLKQFTILYELSLFEWYSLQIDGTKDLKLSDPKKIIINLEKELLDFAETAAAICQLDLVICVDTAVAHLAGGLGKPVWTLNRFVTDWRWILNKRSVEWYPTMNLFRQSSNREWEPVIHKVRNELLNNKF